jgi:hypothetical protein
MGEVFKLARLPPDHVPCGAVIVTPVTHEMPRPPPPTTAQPLRRHVGERGRLSWPIRKLPGPTASSSPLRPVRWAGWAGRLWRRPAARLWRVLPGPALRPRSCPRFLARFRPRLPLSPPSRAAQGGRDHAPVPRSRTACVSRGALSVVGTTYEGRCPGRLSRSCMPLRSLFTRSRSVREILRPEVIGLLIEAVAAAWL